MLATTRRIRDALSPDQEDERRQRMAQAARRLVVERYDWSAVAQDFEDALAHAEQGDSHVFRTPEHVTVPI